MSELYPFTTLSLLTDLYQLTMAYGYWKRGMIDDEGVFTLFFRKKPFNGGFAVFAGLENVISFLSQYRFSSSDLQYLAALKGEEGVPLFEEGFLSYLENLRFTCDVDAVCEGEIVFPYEPLIRVQGPLIQCQLLESILLNLVNFPTLIATKAKRVVLSAKGDPVIEFGMRRAQGIDGALTASRAAFIGGCSATSNVLAGKLFGIPVKGTHAHSWVMAFENELESFKAYAAVMPQNCILLVDTYDTLRGVQNAIEVGKQLRTQGKILSGIRLDSGDLAYLSIEARKLLDAAGFYETKIVASNELNETLIEDLKNQGARIDVWGVGTNLVTGASQAALDGVYKLSALRKKGESWQYKLKLSEQMAKISNPGILQVRRFFHPSWGYIADMIYDIETEVAKDAVMVDPFDKTRQKQLSGNLESRDLLQPLFRGGELVYKQPSLLEMQSYCTLEFAKFDRGIKRFNHPHDYPVGMEETLYHAKIRLVQKVRFYAKSPSHH